MRHDALPVKKWGIDQHFTVALLQGYHEKLVSVGVLFPSKKKENDPVRAMSVLPYNDNPSQLHMNPISFLISPKNATPKEIPIPFQ